MKCYINKGDVTWPERKIEYMGALIKYHANVVIQAWKQFIVQQQKVWEHKTQTRHQRDDRKRHTETKGKRKNIVNYYTPYPKQHLSTQFLFFSPPKDSHVFLSEHMWLTSTSSKGRDGPWSMAFCSKYSLPSPWSFHKKVNNPPSCLFPEAWAAAKDYSPHPACYHNF